MRSYALLDISKAHNDLLGPMAEPRSVLLVLMGVSLVWQSDILKSYRKTVSSITHLQPIQLNK